LKAGKLGGDGGTCKTGKRNKGDLKEERGGGGEKTPQCYSEVFQEGYIGGLYNISRGDLPFWKELGKRKARREVLV